jgi:16S rRNA C967 or C1407 C5-methylase (RsmB/RsmF family)
MPRGGRGGGGGGRGRGGGGGGGRGRGGRGGKWANKRARRDGAAGGDDDDASGGRKGGWEASKGRAYESLEITRSPLFDEYYKAQGIVPEADYEAFVASLLSPLPVTFRVNPLVPQAPEVMHRLATQYSAPFQLDDGTTSPPPRPLPWYEPAGHAWHLHVARHDLRQAAALKELHQWVITLNDAGAISRQEAVSMIPPLLLDVQPHHAVLDMCASPGSKTAQMLEALHTGAWLPLGTTAGWLAGSVF